MFWKDNIQKNRDDNGSALKTVTADDYDRCLGSVDECDRMA
jgi:hypothetical protein